MKAEGRMEHSDPHQIMACGSVRPECLRERINDGSLSVSYGCYTVLFDLYANRRSP